MRRRRLSALVAAALVWSAAGLVPARAGSGAPAAGTDSPRGNGQDPGVVVSVAVHQRIKPINEALLGTNQPVPGAGTLISQLGVDWARADMSLDASYDCATGTWDPAPLDQRVREDRTMGGDPELIVDYSPPCMTSNPLHETLDPPDANGYSDWKALVERAAYHEITAYGVHIFEVWNEPDGTFWHGTIADYLEMYQATASAITAAAEKAARGVLIGGPALVFSDPVWLEPFLEYVEANRLPLGFVSWHYYGNYPALGPFATAAGTLPPKIPGADGYWYNPAARAQTYGLQVRQVEAEISRYPDLHPLTVIDEWNLDAGYDPRADQPYDAAFAAAVLDSVQSAGLDRMAFFRVADDAPHTLGNWGMLFSDLTPKPVYHSFAFWHALTGTQLATTVNPVGGDVGAVASIGTGSTITVLAYNYAPYGPGATETVRVTFPGIGQGAWTYTVRMIDESDQGGQIGSGTFDASGGAITVAMRAESVALITLRPSR